MSYDDFKKHFTDFDITFVSIDQLYADDAGQGSKCKGNLHFYRLRGSGGERI